MVFALAGATVGGTLARKRRNEIGQLNKQLQEANKQLRLERRRRNKELRDASLPRELSEPYITLLEYLRAGKRLLRQEDSEGATRHFKHALDRIEADSARQDTGTLGYTPDRERKKALRGLAAAKRLDGDPNGALWYYGRVLELSEALGDHTGDADVYGAMADMHTELGEYDKAGEYYDKLINSMELPDYAGDYAHESTEDEAEEFVR